MGILCPAPTSPTATLLWRTSGCSRRRPSSCGPERPICAVRRLSGVLRHVLCGNDAAAGGAGGCRRRCARDLILLLGTYAAIFFRPRSMKIFVVHFFLVSRVPCIPFVGFFFFPRLVVFVQRRCEMRRRWGERSHILETGDRRRRGGGGGWRRVRDGERTGEEKKTPG